MGISRRDAKEVGLCSQNDMSFVVESLLSFSCKTSNNRVTTGISRVSTVMREKKLD